jgi:hypothetical protein
LLSPGTFFSQSWTCDGESSGSISVVVRDASITLGYRVWIKVRNPASLEVQRERREMWNR